MSPDQAINALDRALADVGETVTLRRVAASGGQPPVDCSIPALVRAYASHELSGGINQGDTKVILSPTAIVAAGWPGASTIRAGDNPDATVPNKGDKVVIAGRLRTIEAAAPFYFGAVLVRIELQVRG